MSEHKEIPAGETPAHDPMNAQQKGVLAVAIGTAFLAPFMMSALNLSVTDISSQFSCGATTVTWVVNIFTLVTAVLCVPFGHLSDISDRRRILLIGIGLFALACLASALAPSVGWLIFFRGVQGVAAAMFFSSNIPALLAAFPPSQRGRMLGFSVTAVYVGLSIGPVLGGLLNAAFGWRSIFLVAFAVSAGAFFLALRHIVRSEVPGKREHDLLGNLLCVLMLSALLLGLSTWSGNWWAKALVLLGALLFPCFVIWENRAAAPVVRMSLFAHDLGYGLSNLAALLNYGATFAISYSMSLYLQNVKGMPTYEAGLVLICQPIVMAVISPFAGRLSDRIAPHKLASVGMAVTAIGLFLLSTIREDYPLWRIITALLVVGFGFGLFSSPNTNAVLSCVDKSHYGEANSILGTMRTLGQSVSMVIIMFILGACVGNVVIREAAPDVLTYAIRTAMLVYAFICLIGTGISLVRNKATKA